jgi:hypothetical protein
MSQSADDPIWIGLERRLAAVEAWIGEPAPWRPAETAAPLASARVVRGSTFKRAEADSRRGGRRPVALLVLLVVVGLLVTLVVVGGAGRPAPRPVLVPGFNTLGVTAQWDFPAAVALPDGRALVMGFARSGRASASAAIFAPASVTFTPAGSSPTFIGNDQGVAALPDGRVLVTSPSDTSAALFDPATGAFSPTGPLSRVRSSAATAVLHDGRVLVVGGEDDTKGCCTIFSSAEVFDPATGRFMPTGSLSVGRGVGTATTLADGRVLVTDGEQDPGVAELYDPSTGTFSPTGSMRTPRRQHTVSILADGRVLVLGGLATPPPTADDELLGSAEVYDPATGRFSAVGSLVVPRRQASATLLLDGRVLVTGGLDLAGTGTGLPSELFDPSTLRFSLLPDSLVPSMPFGSAATRLADGDVLIVASDGTVELFHP